MKSYKKMTQSHQETEKELYDAIKSGGGSIDIVNVVEEGNMSAVTSNAVAKAIKGETSTSKVIVIVTQEGTTSPIAGASVKLDETESITNQYGQCLFENIKYGVHVLKIICSGYKDYMESFNVDTESKTVSVELSQDIPETAKLNIIVTDNNTGSFIKGAVVKVGNETLTTDDNGQCSFEDLQYTSYIINVYCANYEDYTDSIFIQQQETNYNIQLIPEQETETIRIAGTVLDKRGVLPGVNITELSSGKVAVSDEDGYYVLDIPKPSTNTLNITMNKTYYETLAFNVKLDTRTYYDIPNKTLTLMNNPPSNSNISGQAVYEDYESSIYEKGAGNVMLLLKCSDNTYPLTTYDNGDFRQYGLIAGSYNVEIDANPNYKSEIIEDAFFLRPDESLDNIKIKLTRITHDFTLTLVYADSGDFVANTEIEIYSDKGMTDEIANGETSITGKFYFTVSNELTDYLYGKVYLSSSDIRTITVGNARDTNNKVKI